MLLKLVEASWKEEERRTAGTFWFSDLCECPRKVLLKRQGAEGFLPPPRRLLVRRLQGFAMEGAVGRMLQQALPRTNRRTLMALLEDHPRLLADLAWAIATARLQPTDIHPWAVAQFPFARTVAGQEVHGRVDYLLAVFDTLHILEVKNVGYEGARRMVRGSALPPGFLVQLGCYVHHLGLPGYLHVFSQLGEAREYRFQERDGEILVDGAPARVGGLPPHRFAEVRLQALAQATVADFPIVEVASREYRVLLPEGFPAHAEDRYALVVTRKGQPRMEISRDGETVRAHRCPYCPARAVCYPDLPWKEREDDAGLEGETTDAEPGATDPAQEDPCSTSSSP